MMTTQFIYKCRLCKEEIAAHTSEIPFAEAPYTLINTMVDDKGQPPFINHVHDCRDGGIGVTDLIGARQINQPK